MFVGVAAILVAVAGIGGYVVFGPQTSALGGPSYNLSSFNQYFSIYPDEHIAIAPFPNPNNGATGILTLFVNYQGSATVDQITYQAVEGGAVLCSQYSCGQTSYTICSSGTECYYALNSMSGYEKQQPTLPPEVDVKVASGHTYVFEVTLVLSTGVDTSLYAQLTAP